MRGVDIDDGFQEVFLVLQNRLPDYEERGNAQSWLYSICKRVARAQQRKLRARREHHTTEFGQTPILPTQFQHIAFREAVAVSYQLLQTLPTAQRTAIWLYEVEELPMVEIAKVLDCPAATAYSRIRRAREHIATRVRHKSMLDCDPR